VGPGGQLLRTRLSIAPNPSHLEAVNPVVLGMVRAEQARRGAGGRAKVLGLLLHGDAAVAGERRGGAGARAAAGCRAGRGAARHRRAWRACDGRHRLEERLRCWLLRPPQGRALSPRCFS
jgi:hypothetical protein